MITPLSAYELLEPLEKAAVDDYVKFAVDQQIKKRQRIINALDQPIPSEYIRRSREALYKPLLRAAITERIKQESSKHDISADRLIEEHAKIAFSEITDFLEQGPYGEFMPKPVSNWPKDKIGSVKSVETKPGSFGMSVKITMHDKHPSLKTMGELMGLTSPDAPPPLRNYVASKSEELVLEAVPEKAYVELLESLGETCVR